MSGEAKGVFKKRPFFACYGCVCGLLVCFVLDRSFCCCVENGGRGKGRGEERVVWVRESGRGEKERERERESTATGGGAVRNISTWAANAKASVWATSEAKSRGMKEDFFVGGGKGGREGGREGGSGWEGIRGLVGLTGPRCDGGGERGREIGRGKSCFFCLAGWVGRDTCMKDEFVLRVRASRGVVVEGGGEGIGGYPFVFVCLCVFCCFSSFFCTPTCEIL